MQDWAKVVVQPLGLAGFALFLVFGVLARVKRNDQRRWLSSVAVAMAFVALIGGLALSWLKERNTAAAKPAPIQVQSIHTTGDASPVFVGTGAVTYTADQGSAAKSKDLKQSTDPKASPTSAPSGNPPAKTDTAPQPAGKTP